jgi:hypothetical protein
MHRGTGKHLQTLAYQGQQTVAYAMAIQVVDGFEAVQVDDADGKGLIRVTGSAQRLVEGTEKLSTVGQAGQAVQVRQAQVFVAQPLGVGLGMKFL